MDRKIRKLTILVLLLVMFPFKSFSQFIDLKENTYWADAGLGLSSEGFLTGVSINYVQDGILYKLRFNVSEEFILFGPRPTEISFNSGVLYGKLFSHRFLQVQFSGGLGLTWGTKRGELLYVEPGQGWFNISDGRVFEADKFITPSIPLEMEVYIVPVRFVSLSAGLFCDINLKMPTFGFLIKVGAGRYR